MQSFTLVLELPDTLAKNAQELGLLDAKQIIGLIEKELERKFYAQQFKATLDHLQALEPRLTEAEIDTLATAVSQSNPTSTPLFAEKGCIACHGEDGKGMQAMGSANLTDNIWLYGGSEKTIIETITNGRSNAMPAHRELIERHRSSRREEREPHARVENAEATLQEAKTLVVRLDPTLARGLPWISHRDPEPQWGGVD